MISKVETNFKIDGHQVPSNFALLGTLGPSASANDEKVIKDAGQQEQFDRGDLDLVIR